MRQNQNYFDEIYRKYAKKIYYYIFKMCGDAHQTEDILQTTFLKAIERADAFRGESDVVTWLCRIAKNVYLDELRRSENKNVSLERKLEESGDVLAADSVDVLTQIIDAQDKKMLYLKIHELNEIQREVVLQRLLGLSFQEIGEIFGKKETWARVTFYRAKEQLVKTMGG